MFLKAKKQRVENDPESDNIILMKGQTVQEREALRAYLYLSISSFFFFHNKITYLQVQSNAHTAILFNRIKAPSAM